MFVQPRGSDHALFHPSPDNVWYCRCLLFFTIVVQTDVMGSVRIKCALLSKLEPYGAPDPEPDDWMRKAETCRLYELAPTVSPTPRLFVHPAGNTGTIPFSMRSTSARIIQEEGVIRRWIRGTARKHLGDEMAQKE